MATMIPFQNKNCVGIFNNAEPPNIGINRRVADTINDTNNSDTNSYTNINKYQTENNDNLPVELDKIITNMSIDCVMRRISDTKSQSNPFK